MQSQQSATRLEERNIFRLANSGYRSMVPRPGKQNKMSFDDPTIMYCQTCSSETYRNLAAHPDLCASCGKFEEENWCKLRLKPGSLMWPG